VAGTQGSTTAASISPSDKLVPTTGVLFGAYVDPENTGGDGVDSKVTTLEAQVGRKLAVDQHYYAWTDTFPSRLEERDLANGRIPLVSWRGTTLSTIISGSTDAMIKARARGLKALAVPVFLRWGWEMNGDQYPWDGAHNNDFGQTDGPAKYVAAWRHIHDLFMSEGATNVVWVWAPNNADVPRKAWNSWRNYYPGDAYVDWVGIDGYNWGVTRSWSSWTSFASLFKPVYHDYAATKPIMIAETSSAELGGSKAQWIDDAHAAIKTLFPSIHAFIWFDVLKENDWRVNSSEPSLASYRAVAADPYFAAMPALPAKSGASSRRDSHRN
jgi:endoglucanase